MSAALPSSPLLPSALSSSPSRCPSRRSPRRCLAARPGVTLFASAASSGKPAPRAPKRGEFTAQVAATEPDSVDALEQASSVTATLPPAGSNPLDTDVEEVLLSREQLQTRVAQLASRISLDLAGRDDVIFLGVLTGAFMFTSDLLKHLTIPAEVKFVKASSYGSTTESSGDVTISTDMLREEDVCGKTVVIVEDIVDTGGTLAGIVGFLREMQPREVLVACLLDKPSRRVVEVQVDYKGFTIPDKFVIGYGLDFAEKYRCLPYIGVLKPELYL